MGDAKPAPAGGAPPAAGSNGTRVNRSKKIEGKPHRFTKRPRGYIRNKVGDTFFNPIEVLSGSRREKKPGNAVAPTPYSGYFAPAKPGKEWVDPRGKDKNAGKPKPAPSSPLYKPEEAKPKPAPTATPAPSSAPPATTTPTPAPTATTAPTPTPVPASAPAPTTPAPTSAPTPTPAPTSAPTSTPEPVVETQQPGDLDSGIVCESCEEENSAVKFCNDCDLPLCQACVDSHLKLKVTKTHEIVELPEEVCESCDEGGAAHSYCMECASNLCMNCVDAHLKLKVTKDHKIVRLGEEGEKEN